MEIEFFGQLTENNINVNNLTCDQAITISELAAKLGIDMDFVGLITIDGIQSELHDVVMENNRICFFPYMSGG
jgi:molybdopterin converting factor small subunit